MKRGSKKRCPWVSPVGLRRRGRAWEDPLMLAYHDREWGRPVHDDRKIFEFLILEAFQAGLSWRTVLHKRENFRKAFAGFDPKKVAAFGARERRRLLKDAGIIRNRAKIDATINNAKRFLEVQKEFGTRPGVRSGQAFSAYMWSWVDGKPVKNRIRTIKDYRATSKESDAWAKDLKRRGFKFLGSTVVYAHMQAVGMVNDHAMNCFRR